MVLKLRNFHFDSCVSRYGLKIYCDLLQVTRILRKSEFSADVNLGSVKSFDSNQLASNSPIEDARSEARCLLTTGMPLEIVMLL